MIDLASLEFGFVYMGDVELFFTRIMEIPYVYTLENEVDTHECIRKLSQYDDPLAN